jgi:diaminopimelate decarboxylase
VVNSRVRELALRLDAADGLPAYVYDLTALGEQAAAIRAALPEGVEFYYAVKANPDVSVLRTLAGWVDGLEVSSGGEVRHAAGVVAGERLAFGGPGKTPGELAEAVAAGVGRFHVESPHELRLLGAAARAAGQVVDVLLRVNLPLITPAPFASPTPSSPLAGGASLIVCRKGADSAPFLHTIMRRPGAPAFSPAGAAASAALVMGGRASPFGMDPGLLEECGAVLGSLGPVVRVRGLHAHTASGLDADESVAGAARVLGFGREWCARHGVTAPEFNLGGGMAVDYRQPDARFDWNRYGQGLAALARPGETLRIEPGRAVTAYCGWYLTRVLDVKHGHGEAFAVVGGGTHQLRTPAAKGHDQPFTVIPVPHWRPDWPRPGTGPGPVTVCGQLCTPKDILARQVPVQQLRSGDLIAFGLAGAYAWNISHQSFLMHPAPAFHYL